MAGLRIIIGSIFAFLGVAFFAYSMTHKDPGNQIHWGSIAYFGLALLAWFL